LSQLFLSSISRNKIVYSSICRERNVSFFPVFAEIFILWSLELEVLEKGSLHPLLEPRDIHASAGIQTPAAYTASENSSKKLSRQFNNNYSEHEAFTLSSFFFFNGLKNVFAGAAVSSRANETAGSEESPSRTPGSEMDTLPTSLVCEHSATLYIF
jgi:hypothetical protein